jgi:MFS family permease
LATGHVADRFDRRRVTFISQLVEALAVAVLAAANFGAWLTPGLLLAMAFVVGTGRAFEQPSLQSVLPNIVSGDVLPHAIAASTSGSQTAIVAGPALGGILVAISPTLVYAVCAAIWLSAGIVILGIAREKTIARATERKPPRRALADIKAMFSGLTFITGNRVLLGAVLLDLFAVVLGNSTALLPIFASDIFHNGPLGFGVLRAAPAAGAIITALVLARRPVSGRVGHIMFVTVSIYGVATILLALTPGFGLALAALAVIGASDTVSVVIRQTMVQIRTPDAMRGRVYAVNSMITITSNQLGVFRAGSAAALFGTIPSVLIGGLCTIAVVLISTKIFRELYDADRYDAARP